jgi:protein-S-isoprenylcysteine O-methyltransferase Ste14
MTLTSRRRAAAMLLGLPVITWYAWVCLTFFDGALVPPVMSLRDHAVADYLPRTSLISVMLYLSWLILQVALHVVLPGHSVEGTLLADGSRLIYRLNGLQALVGTVLVLYAAVLLGMPPTIAYDEFAGLLVSATVTAFLTAAIVSARASQDLPHRADPLTHYVTGASLNPRVRQFDIKFFCESRPGLLLWVALNASCAAKQYEVHGVVSTPMLLVNMLQLLYVADYFLHEEAILTTWDIKHERFGWMLCWGCLVWVPFMYSIQAHYLVTHTHELSPLATAAIVALNMIGYVIFRSANLQKHRFRRDPSRAIWGRPPDFIRTESGTLLLTSGWWGMARHLNYFGDLLMGLAWCLPTGFAHPITYFYIVYFLILLIHRERRDHRMCLQRYGSDWEAYCRRVPWRIVPGLY